MKSMISPSIMCADFGNILAQLKDMKEAGIEYLHVDIMDGTFVPNYTLGTDFCKFLKKNSPIPLDYHLMIADPEQKIPWFPISEGDYVSVHFEAGYHPHRSLQTIRQLGGKPMLALNPATPLSALDYVLEDIDGVLIMTVNPGFAGQKLVSSGLEKIAACRKYLDERGFAHLDIEVDGNVSLENAKKMRAAGANIFVAGTSSIFKPDGDLKGHIQELREACC